MVKELVHPDANTIFGATFDDSLGDEIRVTVIATGFEEDQSVPFPHQEQVKPAQTAAPERSGGRVIERPAPAPVQEDVKAPVSDDDWDILERIFSKKK